MVTGTITDESLGEVLRSLSHKKRNGFLDVSYQGSQLRLAFQEGRIVGAERSGQSSAVSISERLVRGGCLVPKALNLIAGAGISAEQLQTLLISRQYVSQDEFVRAKQGYELDLLHSLRELRNGQVHFTPKLVRSEPQTSINIYPGQLLLDLAEIEHDSSRFDDLFEPEDETVMTVRAIGELSEHASPSEQLVLDAAFEGATAAEIAERTLLSRYEVMEALLALYDQGVLELIEGEAELDLPGDGAHSESLFGEPAPLIDKDAAFAPETPAEEASADMLAAKPEQLRNTAESLNGSGAVQTAEAFQADADGFFDPALAAEAAEAVPTPEAYDGGFDAEPVAALDSSVAGFRGQLRALNYRLMDPEVAQTIVVFGTLGFLFIFALIGAELFREWFDALESFTVK